MQTQEWDPESTTLGVAPDWILLPCSSQAARILCVFVSQTPVSWCSWINGSCSRCCLIAWLRWQDDLLEVYDLVYFHRNWREIARAKMLLSLVPHDELLRARNPPAHVSAARAWQGVHEPGKLAMFIPLRTSVSASASLGVSGKQKAGESGQGSTGPHVKGPRLWDMRLVTNYPCGTLPQMQACCLLFSQGNGGLIIKAASILSCVLFQICLFVWRCFTPKVCFLWVFIKITDMVPDT